MGFSVFLVLITVVCFLLIVVIMVQNPKGGGLSSTFGSSQQIGGVQKTNDFIDKATWSLAAVIMVLSIVITIQKKSISKVTPQEAPTEQSQGGAPANPAGQPSTPK